MKFIAAAAIFASLSLSTHASVTPKTLTSTLTKSGVDTTQIGCKCIMTAPTANNTDSTSCLCYNRKDGTLNDSDKCSKYTGK